MRNLLQAGGNGMREQEGEECEVCEAGGKAEGRRGTVACIIKLLCRASISMA